METYHTRSEPFQKSNIQQTNQQYLDTYNQNSNQFDNFQEQDNFQFQDNPIQSKNQMKDNITTGKNNSKSSNQQEKSKKTANKRRKIDNESSQMSKSAADATSKLGVGDQNDDMEDYNLMDDFEGENENSKSSLKNRKRNPNEDIDKDADIEDGGKSEQNEDDQTNMGKEQQKSKFLNILQVNAYAILRSYSQDYTINSKEVFLGRRVKWLSQDQEDNNKDSNFIKVSLDPKISRKAARLYFNEKSEDFVLQNLSKNALMVDRAPLLKNYERVLNHKSLIQIGDTLLFFLLPQEHLEKKKRLLKERRKVILEEANILNPPKNNFDINSSKRSKYGVVQEEGQIDGLVTGQSILQGQKKLKYGIGKRMNLKEKETMSQLGMSFLPPGTKAPPAQPQTIKSIK